MKKLCLLSALVLALGTAACSDDDDDDCIDIDGDGYGVGEDCLGTDCDDDDASAHETLTGYPDGDSDGVYSATAEQLCVAALPTGYSATAGDDCDDDDATVSVGLTGYMDADEDGYGDATAVEFCTAGTLPTGYVDDGTDCDDTDALVWELVSGYEDYDDDGVVSAAASTACTDGDLPAGWVTVAGTDCDDHDMTASVDGSDIGCTLPGLCVDSEGMSNPAAADFRGIGSCAGADCNGMDPTCADATPVAQSTTCTADTDCLADDDYCMGGYCQRPPECCSFDTAGLTCSEIPDCLQDCKDQYYPANLPEYIACLQFDCYEGATPKAQFLYATAQLCAAENGCFVAEDELTCVATNCISVFGPCLADEP